MILLPNRLKNVIGFARQNACVLFVTLTFVLKGNMFLCAQLQTNSVFEHWTLSLCAWLDDNSLTQPETCGQISS